MEENNPINPNQELQQETGPQVEPLTKSEAMTGVITAPSDTFATIASSAKMNYWILPILVFMVLNVIGSFIVQNDGELMGKIMDKQATKMKEQFDEKVKSGAMTQAEADQAMETAQKFMNPSNLFFKIIGYGAGLITPFLYLFVSSVICLIIMKILRSGISFGDVLNVIGLSLIIVAISSVLTTIISVLMGDLQTISLGLILNEESVGEKAYGIISRLDIFSIWYIAVASIGLSKLGKISIVPVSVILYAFWLVFVIVMGLLF